ncbi:MAG: TonB-dependent receptor [Thermomicrobiales bacterium]
MLIRGSTRACATAIVLVLAAPVSAQEISDSASDESQPATGVSDIVVTAQRRAQSLQHVPVAVTALNAESLSKSGVSDIGTLGAVTPGLVLSTNRASVTPYLRGVGTASGDPGGSASIAIYVDGVYYNAPAAGFFALNNVERVEVIKGPQGTLFGRNATGGLIHIITKDPSFTPSGEASIGYGNYDTVTGSFYATTGLSDQLAIDVSAYGNYQGDGFGKNLTTGTDVSYRREIAVRSKLLWEPGDSTRLILSGDYSGNSNDAGHFRTIAPGTLGAGATPFRGSIYDTQSNLPSDVHASQMGVSLTVEQELGLGTLASTSAFRRVKSRANFDQDSTPLPIVNAIFGESTDTYQQEFTLNGDKGILDYTLGLFLFDMSAKTTPISIRTTPPPLRRLNVDRYAEQSARSYAAFAQVTAKVTPSTRLTAGFRYSIDKIGIDAVDIAAPNNPNGAVGTVVDTTVGTANANGKTFKSPTWRLAIDRDVGDSTLVYASYSRGFKAGQYNVNSFNNPPVRPEELDAYEVGIKSDLFGRQFRANLAAFYYKYRDIQLSRVGVGAPTLVNAAEARIQGLDIETTFVPDFAHGNFQLRASASLLDGEYTDFPGAPTFIPNPTGGNIQSSINAKGFDTIRSPKFTANVTAQQTIPTSFGELSLSATYFHSAKFYFDPDERTVQNAYDLLNGQISFTFPGDQVYIRVWGKNLTDEVYYSTWSASTLGDLVVAAPPRTFGATVGVRW